MIRQLLEAGVDVNYPNIFGMTALLLVAGYGNERIIEMLLASGADATVTNQFGHNALHLAVVGRRTQLRRLLASSPDSVNRLYYNLNRRDIDTALRDWAATHPRLVGPRTDELDKVRMLLPLPVLYIGLVNLFTVYANGCDFKQC